MATANQPDDINLDKLKVQEDSTTAESAAPAKKADKPKKEKQKKEKAPAPAAVATPTETAPVEELDFNRPEEEVQKSLQDWVTKATAFNKPNRDEKL